MCNKPQDHKENREKNNNPETTPLVYVVYILRLKRNPTTPWSRCHGVEERLTACNPEASVCFHEQQAYCDS